MDAGREALAKLEAELKRELERAQREGLRRRIAPRAGIDFCTNDYLGLAADGRLAAAACDAAHAEGTGARAARLLGGESDALARAEKTAAAWLRCERTLLLSSGWQANAALLGALLAPGDTVLSDERNHASLVDGMRATRARRVIFRHRDLGDLERALRQPRASGRCMIITDAVFSMTGQAAPLREIVALAEAHGAIVVVDEAHAGGVVGPRGAGLCAALGLELRVAARVVTGGKALGGSGAWIAGSEALIETVLQRGRPFLFTTAPAPPTAAVLARSVELMEELEPRRAELRERADHLRRALAERKVAFIDGESPIVFVKLGSPARALEAAARIGARGFDVRAVRPPTVPQGESGLRIVVHAGHAVAELDALAVAVRDSIVEFSQKETAPVSPSGPPALAVVGTDTGVGKTVVSALFVKARAALGPVAYWKPVQSGSGEDDDSATVARWLAQTPRARVLPPCYAFEEAVAPHQAARKLGRTLEPAQLESAARAAAAEAGAGALLLETAGGVLVPICEHLDQAALLSKWRLPVVLVARTGLGTLNHTFLTVEALAARSIPCLAVVLSGPRHAENERDLRERLSPIPVLWVPPMDEIAGAGPSADSALAQQILDVWKRAAPWARFAGEPSPAHE